MVELVPLSGVFSYAATLDKIKKSKTATAMVRSCLRMLVDAEVIQSAKSLKDLDSKMVDVAVGKFIVYNVYM